MNIQFKLRLDKIDADGKAPVFLQFLYKDYKFVYFTKEKCNPKQWDEEKKKFKRSFPGYQDANAHLESLEDKVKKSYREYLNKGIVPTPAMLKSDMLPEVIVPKRSFFEVFDEFLKEAAKSRQASTMVNYKTLRDRLAKFEKFRKAPLDIENITLEVSKRFVDFLIYECNHSPTTVDTTVSQLKVFLKYVFDNLPFIKLHPDHQRIKSSNKPQEKVFLEWEEIERMMVAEGLTDNEAKVRDVYLFSCFTGLRFSDVMGLVPSNVVTRTLNGQTIQILSLIQQKTKRRVVVALSEYATQILQKYTIHGGFLPRFEKSLANRKIRCVGVKAGITAMVQKVVYEKGLAKTVMVPKYECLNYHTSRHTFATQCLLKGMDIKTVQELLGHSDLRSTLIYAKITDEHKHVQMLTAWKK